MSDNPLLAYQGLPPFPSIQPEHVKPALTALLAENRKKIQALVSQPEQVTWQTLMLPLQEMDDHLDRLWSPVRHLNSVLESPQLREVYAECVDMLSEYSTEISQNQDLYKAYQALADQELDDTQKKIVSDALRDFRLGGVDLRGQQKERYKEIQAQLAKLTTRFEQHLLDATQAHSFHFD